MTNPRIKFDTKDMETRILNVYMQATPEELNDGIQWYHAANTFAHGCAKKYGVTEECASGIIAALSPQTSWQRNVSIVSEFFRSAGKRATGQSQANIHKAREIYAGHSPYDVLYRRQDTGKKVRSFFTCINAPNVTDQVCIDRHAFAIATGTLLDDRERNNLLRRRGVYEAIASAYQNVAQSLNVRPHQVQAVTWVAWRARLKEQLASA